MLLVSFATSVPLPRAIPILALFKAGASLTPSPVTATKSPFLLNDSTISSFCIGLTLENTFFVLTNLSNSPNPFFIYFSNVIPSTTSS